MNVPPDGAARLATQVAGVAGSCPASSGRARGSAGRKSRVQCRIRASLVREAISQVAVTRTVIVEVKLTLAADAVPGCRAERRNRAVIGALHMPPTLGSGP